MYLGMLRGFKHYSQIESIQHYFKMDTSKQIIEIRFRINLEVSFLFTHKRVDAKL